MQNDSIVGIEEFLRAAFDPETLPKTERICLGVGEGGTQNVSGTDNNIKKLPIGTSEIYVCLSTVVVPEGKGSKLRRRADDIRQAYLIVFDDIGTKCAEPPVEPSYKLQTSIKDGVANYQWGYFLTAFDVTDPASRAYFDACLMSAAAAGWNDPGLRSASRIVRVPGALHQKSGFIAAITDWHPDRVWDLPELMAELGLDPEAVVSTHPPVRQGAVSLNDVHDPLYDWLQAQNLVVQIKPDFIDIVCPWADQHSDNRVEAGYSPLDYGTTGRQFKCLHGHCAKHGTAEFIAWVTSQGGPPPDALPLTSADQAVFQNALAGLGSVTWSNLSPTGPAPVAAPTVPQGAALDALEGFVYSTTQQTWIHCDSGAYTNVNSLRAYIGRLMPLTRRGKRQPPDELWFENPNRILVADKVWYPGASKGVVEYLDAPYWNTYEPYQPPIHPDRRISELFHYHILDTFGPEGRHLEQWLGWAAQHPEEKILWAPLLVGIQGDGKSLLADALGLAVGPQRLHRSSTTAISGNFNAFLEGKFVLAIEELRVNGQNRHQILDKLKDVVTNPYIEIRPKGFENRTAPNFTNVIAFTNHLDALPLDNTDRRWGIFTSRFILGNGDLQGERLDVGYFDTIMGALRHHPEAVIGWLMSIDLGGFDPKARAPFTVAKGQMIMDAAGEHDLAVIDVIRGRTHTGITPHAVVLPQLRRVLKSLDMDDEPNRLAAILRAAGFMRGPNGVRVGGDLVRVWYDARHYDGSSPAKALAAARDDLEANNQKLLGGLLKP